MNPGRPGSSEYHARYGRYIDLVPEVDLLTALTQQLDKTETLRAHISETSADTRYAPGKWTIREVVGHIVDTERLLGYRLLCFARGDTTMLPRADEDLYVNNADFRRYSLGELFDEFGLIRRSHESLIRHLPEAAWDRVGIAADVPISVRALGYLMLGHERHHINIIQNRYLKSS